ncbi:MAG: creatininase family protein [Gemmatimonadetes bacterium]|nr:creatininase family protein [Gemmatimonadota bacterium]
MRSARFVIIVLALAVGLPRVAQAQQRQMTDQERARRRAEQAQQLQEELRSPRPIEALNSVWIEELTWMEVRDAIAAGKTTAIISTGGIEQNGPYVATGKHNYILQSACEWIARDLGNALCAPILKLVPEGNIEEPSGHMRYPGTISLREETFQAVLDDIASSLKAHGFKHIIFIGDSGGNQRGMRAVAERLNERWTDAHAHYIPEYYDNNGVVAFMENELGIAEGESDGFHDFYWITALQMVTDPATVRYDQRVAKGLASINGVSIMPKEKTIDVGRRLMRWRADQTVRAIEAAISASE